MTELEILRRARALVARRDGWVKGLFAASIGSKEAVEIYNSEPSNTCYCIVGAVRVTAGTSNYTGADIVERELFTTLLQLGHSHMSSVPSFNDSIGTSQADVVALADLTIERMEAVQ